MIDGRTNTPRILLLTPYCGGNLGDGAIQDALITDLRRRLPNAEIIGLTLFPDRTSELHNLPCYSVSAVKTRYYSPIGDKPKRPSESSADSKGATETSTSSLRNFVKGIPVISAVARKMLSAARSIAELVVMVGRETRHVAQSRRLMKTADLLLIAGGGQIDDEWGGPWGHPYVLRKWTRLAKACKVPSAMISLGFCDLHSSLSRRLVASALRNVHFATFRDQRSLMRARGLVGKQDFSFAPDLAFGYPTQSKQQGTDKQNFLIALSPIAYLCPDYWPTADAETYTRCVSQLAEFVCRRLESGDQFMLFTTSSADHKTVDLLGDKVAERVGDAKAALQVVDTRTVGALVKCLERADVVVASRLHAVILSHVLNIPTVAVQYDPKVVSHMVNMEMSDYCVDIHSVTSDELNDAYCRLSANHEIAVRIIRGRVSDYRRLLTLQMDNIVELARTGTAYKAEQHETKVPLQS